MRDIFAALGLESDTLHQPLVLGLQFHQRLRRSEGGYDLPRFAPAKRYEIFDAQFERLAPHASQHGCDLVRDNIIHIANEAQRDMIVLGIDPACARQAATQHRQRLAHVEWNLETGKEAGHGNDYSVKCAYRASCADSHAACNAHIARPLRTRRTSSSTLGRIRATIASTPAAVRWSPSLWLSPAAPARPSRKKG